MSAVVNRPGDPTLLPPRPAVEVVGVSKRFPLLARRRDRFKLLLGHLQGLAFTAALEDVSVSIRAGEAVGVIGENGSGKSTLLRLVAGISQPDVGSIVTEQPVSAILELGLGFHPDFTGRENALLYGTLLGVPEIAMRERLPEVLAFAELGDFIDQPIRTYSSGMVARLAFAVATNVEPRVLVVDEALAVGDGAFQKKCVDRMVGFRDQGRTVLFCSHAMYLVTSFCQRAVWLHKGRVQMQGEVQEVVKAYGAHLKRREGQYESAHPRADHADPAAPGSLARLDRPRVTTLDGRPDTPLHPGDGFQVQVRFHTASAASAFHVAVVVDTMDGQCVFAAATQRDGRPPVGGRREHELWLRVPSLPLAAGTFIVKAFLFDENGLHHYDQAVNMDGLRVAGGSWTPSLLALPHEWVVSE